MNPHRAKVSDRAPRVADVVAPERGLSTGRYRAGRARNKGRHSQPARASRLFPKWAIPKVVAIATTSMVVVSTVVVVAVVASGGGAPNASPATTTTAAIITTTPVTEPATSTTVSVASFWSTLMGSYTGRQVVDKAYTPGFGYVTPKTDLSVGLQATVAPGCTTVDCTVTVSEPGAADPPVTLDVALVNGSLHITKTELVPCADGEPGSESGTWDILMSITGHAPDGSVTQLEGNGTLHVAQVNGCPGAAPVDWFITWTFTRA